MADQLIEVRYDEQDLQAIERSLRAVPNALRRIVPPSLNRTASWTRTRIRRAVAAQLRVKQRRAMSYVLLDRATGAKWSSGVRVRDRIVSVAQFATATAGGVSVSFPSGLSQSYPHAFLATMPSGHLGVYRRDEDRPRRRPWRKSPTSGHRYQTDLPIYELGAPLAQVLKLDFVKPLSLEGLQRLDAELAGRIKAVVLGTMGTRRRPTAA
jgi:hypothetical protein